jgi:hypothetical protein
MRRVLGAIAGLVLFQLAATAQPRELELNVPPTAVAANIQITVRPSKGAVLLYTAPNYDSAIRFPGPSSTRMVPLSSRTVRVELVDGAKSFRVKVLGRIDALGGSKLKSPSK